MSDLLFPPPPSLVSLLHRGKRFWLATHVHPDHDGFGSMLAMGQALRATGREAVVFYAGDGPKTFDHLPGVEMTAPCDHPSDPPDALILFDCHQLRRIEPGVAARADGVVTAVVDHHVADEPANDPLHWIVRDAPATACLVHSLIQALGIEVDADMATCLYSALLTDTGGFRHSNTTPAALRCAADLVDAGASASELADRLLHRRRPEALRLMGEIFSAAEYCLDGRAVIVTIEADALARTQATLEEVEGVSGFFTSAEGVELVAVLKPGDGEWRVSLRSAGSQGVQELAKSFGGGGHRQAAGFESTLELDDLRTRLEQEFATLLAQDD